MLGSVLLSVTELSSAISSLAKKLEKLQHFLSCCSDSKSKSFHNEFPHVLILQGKKICCRLYNTANERVTFNSNLRGCYWIEVSDGGGWKDLTPELIFGRENTPRHQSWSQAFSDQGSSAYYSTHFHIQFKKCCLWKGFQAGATAPGSFRVRVAMKQVLVKLSKTGMEKGLHWISAYTVAWMHLNSYLKQMSTYIKNIKLKWDAMDLSENSE